VVRRVGRGPWRARRAGVPPQWKQGHDHWPQSGWHIWIFNRDSPTANGPSNHNASLPAASRKQAAACLNADHLIL
jgi:hypothetical protein